MSAAYVWVCQIDDSSILMVWEDGPGDSICNSRTVTLFVPAIRINEQVKPVPKMLLEGLPEMSRVSVFAGPNYGSLPSKRTGERPCCG